MNEELYEDVIELRLHKNKWSALVTRCIIEKDEFYYTSEEKAYNSIYYGKGIDEIYNLLILIIDHSKLMNKIEKYSQNSDEFKLLVKQISKNLELRKKYEKHKHRIEEKI